MTPRPEWLTEPTRPIDERLARTLSAARELLQRGDYGFSLDAVARKAGITRMTVYNQFGSKAGLLEVLFDQLITRGAFDEMPRVFAEPDRAAAFDVLADIFGRFYTENRATLAHLHAAAGADPDLDDAMRRRNDRRQRVIEKLLHELPGTTHAAVPSAELVTVLEVLLSFSTFDAMAGPSRAPKDVVPVVQALVRASLGLPQPRRPRQRRRKNP